jgi:hypothetical protein
MAGNREQGRSEDLVVGCSDLDGLAGAGFDNSGLGWVGFFCLEIISFDIF